jgi:hypothetical protein
VTDGDRSATLAIHPVEDLRSLRAAWAPEDKARAAAEELTAGKTPSIVIPEGRSTRLHQCLISIVIVAAALIQTTQINRVSFPSIRVIACSMATSRDATRLVRASLMTRQPTNSFTKNAG